MDCRLGIGSEIMAKVLMPMPVSIPKHFEVVSVACGEKFCLMLDSFGLVYGWGSNRQHELCFPPTTQVVSKPTKLNFIEELVIKRIGCGRSYAVALDVDNCLYQWGTMHAGQEDSLRPRRVLHPRSRDLPFHRFSCGREHIMALDYQGRLFGWGSNQGGCLLRGTSQQSLPQTEVTAGERVIDFVCGDGFSVMILQNMSSHEQLRKELVITRAKELIKEQRKSELSMNIFSDGAP
jgi:alpha-tubulin suppressor-like RCC1 family protein